MITRLLIWNNEIDTNAVIAQNNIYKFRGRRTTLHIMGLETICLYEFLNIFLSLLRHIFLNVSSQYVIFLIWRHKKKSGCELQAKYTRLFNYLVLIITFTADQICFQPQNFRNKQWFDPHCFLDIVYSNSWSAVPTDKQSISLLLSFKNLFTQLCFRKQNSRIPVRSSQGIDGRNPRHLSAIS